MTDAGKTLLLDAIEACMFASNATRTGSGRPRMTYTRVDDDEGPILVHVDGLGRYQVTVQKEDG
jgi:hypothetical protein